MDAFNADLNEALRYHTEQERKSFEDAIDANPLDSTTHLVYADWLQEQGEHEEADFRRAMGEWVKGDPDVGVASPVSATEWLAGGKLGYPKGVLLQHMDFPRQAGYPQAPVIRSNQPKHYPIGHRNRDQGDTPEGRYHLTFSSYRSMEEAFRRAFKANRKFTSE